MKLRVTAKMAWDGFALRRRREGEVFDLPDKHIRKDAKGNPILPRWAEAVGAKAPASKAAPAAQAAQEPEPAGETGDVI